MGHLLLFFWISLLNTHYGWSHSNHPVLLVLSFDGFRYDYFDLEITPTLKNLRKEGTRAEYMKNVFPTKTFPNHHSIATGLYPETHGVLGNAVRVKNRNVHYSAELYENNLVTPIWTLNEKAGFGRHSGIMMWPGGEFPYMNIQPTFRQVLNTSVSWETRVDQIIEWLKHPTTPANLVMVYFEEPDWSAHPYGPESKVVLKHLRRLDNITKYLWDCLSQTNLSYVVNVIQLSDHGMDIVNHSRIINLTAIVDENLYDFIDTSPVLQLFPKKGKETLVHNGLKNASQWCHFSVYKKEEIPNRWHYKHSPRAPPILAIADIGYAFQDIYEEEKKYRKQYNISDNETMTLGLHGYDNQASSMRPFFLAWGPLIKKNSIIAPFETVDLYSLFSAILDLSPSGTNGSLSNLRGVLRAVRAQSLVVKTNSSFMPCSCICFTGLLLLILLMAGHHQLFT